MENFVVENGVLKKYTGEEANVKIPSEIDGKIITEINGGAFILKRINAVNVSGSRLTKIGEYAFENCTDLEQVTITGKPTIISNVFNGCKKLKKFVYGGKIYTVDNHYEAAMLIKRLNNAKY